MSIFKCKMCGGTIEFEPGATVGVCEYCGTKQTLPKLNDDRRANLYDRANHFRRNNEFDKAAGIYEQILNEDTADAEAYWSLVLCRYGIEYVEDPATRRRVPTVNRAQFTSVFDDDNYKSALQYADGYQRAIYEAEAKEINEIQKGILAISQKEEPFDVFICYKETDNNGRRTQDSVLANDLYHQLTQEGFKVFFARITLEDKLGSAYEPYIFAALNSAKVMVVLGTKPEHFNAVWVKNEWSRYLALVKKSGGKKVLIPAYRDMDPYDLPEEFSHLQAQDMSKLGFMQDLIRGIKKLAQSDEKPTAGKETVVVGGNANTAPLLKRAFMFLEDGNWAEANAYCEKVLDIDPENAEAYLGKLMTELKVRKRENLKDCAEPFDDSSNYQKAVRFGGGALSDELSGAVTSINERNEHARLDGVYNRASNIMRAAQTEDEYQEAASLFESIPDYQDANVLAEECREKAEIARKDAILSDAKEKLSAINTDTTFYGLKHAEAVIDLLQSIPGWKDADEQVAVCRQKIEEIKAKKEADRLEAERKAEERRIAAEKAAKKRKKIIMITTPIVCVVVAFVIVLTTVIIPYMKYDDKYNDAVSLMEGGQYNEAIAVFETLDGYKDSTDKINECKYNDAVAHMETGEYEEAIAVFETLDGYKDSADKITECKYNDAVARMEAGEYDEAYAAFKALNDYKDCAEQANACKLEKLKTAKVGDYVILGEYEQDNNTYNGKEDIEWLVLDKQGTSLLLISKYALDCQTFSAAAVLGEWSFSSLHHWLEKFVKIAFSEEEQAIIATTDVSADPNPEYDTDPGNPTQDKVFLLSIQEVNRYFSSDSARQCKPTDYAVSMGADVFCGFCDWWLRSPGSDRDSAAVVYDDGNVSENGFAVFNDEVAVRPALWVNLEP